MVEREPQTSGELKQFQDWQLMFPEIVPVTLTEEMVTRTESGGFGCGEIEDFCRKSEDPVLLASSLVEEVTEGGEALVESIGFHAEAEWSQGREDSVHQVQFGWLTITNTKGQQYQRAVAVKPFYIMRRQLVNEMGALMKAPQLTGVESFTPLGVVRTDGGIALITEFEDRVVSLDNFDWERDIDASLREELDTVAFLQRAAMSFARLHSSGLVHNDAQVKNVAVARTMPVDGSQARYSIRLIDLEKAAWHDLTDPIDEMRFYDGVRRDCNDFISDVLSRGLWRDARYDDRAKALMEMFAEPYLSYLRHPANFLANRKDIVREISARMFDVIDDV